MNLAIDSFNFGRKSSLLKSPHRVYFPDSAVQAKSEKKAVFPLPQFLEHRGSSSDDPNWTPPDESVYDDPYFTVASRMSKEDRVEYGGGGNDNNDHGDDDPEKNKKNNSATTTTTTTKTTSKCWMFTSVFQRCAGLDPNNMQVRDAYRLDGNRGVAPVWDLLAQKTPTNKLRLANTVSVSAASLFEKPSTVNHQYSSEIQEADTLWRTLQAIYQGSYNSTFVRKIVRSDSFLSLAAPAVTGFYKGIEAFNPNAVSPSTVGLVEKTLGQLKKSQLPLMKLHQDKMYGSLQAALNAKVQSAVHLKNLQDPSHYNLAS